MAAWFPRSFRNPVRLMLYMDDRTVPIPKLAARRKRTAKARKVERGQNLDYRALFDQTSECVFIIGLDLTYLAANQQALDLLGYEEMELVGMPVSKVMSLDEQLTHTSILGEGADLYERILKRRDGTTLPVEISTSLVYETDNQPAYIQSIARDISERKNAEEMLKRQAAYPFPDQRGNGAPAPVIQHWIPDPGSFGIPRQRHGWILLCYF